MNPIPQFSIRSEAKRAVRVFLLYGLLIALDLAFHWSRTPSAVASVLLASLIIPVAVHPYGSTSAMEWLVSAGMTRDWLARRHLLLQIWHSLILGAGVLAWWLIVGRSTLLPGLTAASVFIAGVCAHVIARSLAYMAQCWLSATLWPPRVRDVWRGLHSSTLLGLRVWSVSAVLALALVGAPVVLILWLGPITGSLIPAVLYPLAAFAIGRSIEFAGSNDPLMIFVAPKRTGRVQSLRLALRARKPSVLRGLLWEGIHRRVKVLLLAALANLIIIGVVVVRFAPDWRTVVFALSLCFMIWLAVLMGFGGEAFRWRSYGNTAEFLYMCGVDITFLRRLKLNVSGMMCLIAAFVTAYFLYMQFTNWLVLLPIVAAFLGHLLLSCNESRIGPTSNRRVSSIAATVRVWAIVFVVLNAIWPRRWSAQGDARLIALNVVGAAILIVGLVYWIRDWRRQDGDEVLKLDAFDSDLVK